MVALKLSTRAFVLEFGSHRGVVSNIIFARKKVEQKI